MENNIYLCNKCKAFIFSIINNDKKDIKEIIEDDIKCEFCFSSLKLNNNNYSNLILKIQEKIKEYEYINLNIQTRFSCLFQIFQAILIKKLVKITDNEKDILESIKPGQIRKLFKEDFIPIFINKLNIKVESNPGDMIVIISFNFKQNIYDDFNLLFKEYREKDEKLEPITPEDDNSKIKYYLDSLDITKEKLSEIFPPEKLNKNFYLDIKIEIAPFYIFGNYIKLSREIGQTKFSRDGVKFALTSIDEELKSYLKNIFGNSDEDLVFSAGGREDRDVRMLGNGRAFIYSVFNAKKHYSLDFKEINRNLNNFLTTVKVNGLRICDKKYFNTLKKAESEKIKIYTAVVWSKEEINKDICDKIGKVKDLLTNQITPLRVLHKRVLRTREKFIYEINVKEIINPHFMIIEIKASAGTYIKEFVNGDLGRTYPALCDIIGCECDILQLDVQDIIL